MRYFQLFYIIIWIFLIGCIQPTQREVERYLQVQELEKDIETNKDDYKIRIIDNDYFVDTMNQVLDRGQELLGFYKNGQLLKVEYVYGISCCLCKEKYYYSNNSLFHYSEVQLTFIDQEEEVSNAEVVFECNYFISKGMIIDQNVKGQKYFSLDSNYYTYQELKAKSDDLVKQLNSR